MTMYADLSVWKPDWADESGRMLAVGWLERGTPYAHGDVAKDVIDKLVQILGSPWQPGPSTGRHYCTLCKLTRGPRNLEYKGMTVEMGSSKIFIPGSGCVYVAPSLIAHYIDAHDYEPPAGFCDAVRICPPMRSAAYLRGLMQNGARHLVERRG